MEEMQDQETKVIYKDQETKITYEEEVVNLVPAERMNDDGIQVWKQQDLEIPESDRALEILLQGQNVWKMSMNERRRLHNHWKELIHKSVIQRLADLEKSYADKRKEIDGKSTNVCTCFKRKCTKHYGRVDRFETIIFHQYICCV